MSLYMQDMNVYFECFKPVKKRMVLTLSKGEILDGPIVLEFNFPWRIKRKRTLVGLLKNLTLATFL